MVSILALAPARANAQTHGWETLATSEPARPAQPVIATLALSPAEAVKDAALDQLSLGQKIRLWRAHRRAEAAAAEAAGQAGALIATWYLPALGVMAAGVLIWGWWRDVLRPGSFRRSGWREVDHNGAALWVAAGLAIYGAWILGMGLAASQPWLTGMTRLDASPPTVRFQAVAGLGGTIAAVPMALAMCRLLGNRRGASKSGADASQGLRMRWGDAPRGIGLMVMSWPFVALAGFAAAAAVEIWTAQPIDPIAHETLATIRTGEGGMWRWALLVAPIIGAPIVEEIVFRVCLQGALLSLLGRGWLAILLASAIFAVIHAGIADAHALVPLCVLGVAMGIAYERTRRLGVPIVMHMAFNAVNVLVVVWA